MVEVIIVCYTLFDLLFAITELVKHGKVDVEVHLLQLNHDHQHFFLDHSLDPNCVLSLLVTTLALVAFATKARACKGVG
jgi:hypothetical protein